MLKAVNIGSLSKEDILSKVSSERIMEHYLGIPVQKKLVCNPFRKDNNPGCSFWFHPKGTLYFVD